MFKTCIFCNRNLGSNEVVEQFPVGRRLAFDQEKGRLWVICERCRRWNLSPLDERWEAIEECERRFRDTPRSFSTDNIGLAQLPEGLQLIRIGRPQKREFAAWRYAREFWRRRVRTLVASAVQVAAAIGIEVVGVNILPVFLGVRARRVVTRGRDEDGTRFYVAAKNVGGVRLVRGEGEGAFSLVVPCHLKQSIFVIIPFARGRETKLTLSGPTAIRAASKILPHVNQWGASQSQVESAVRVVDEARDVERLYGRLATDKKISKMPREDRLALEMAAHEDGERRALEGELVTLEEAWREAEEIAAIADRLLFPEALENLFLKLKGEVRSEDERRSSE